MIELEIVKNLKRYTKLMSIKELNKSDFEGLKGFHTDMLMLELDIMNKFDKIKDLNMEFEGYGSLADAILTNSIHIEDVLISPEESEQFIYQNNLLEFFINSNDITFIKCIEFNKLPINNLLKPYILKQFSKQDIIDLNEINDYVRYFLTNNSTEEKIENINMIANKLHGELEELNIDGVFLAKTLFNTSKLDKLYFELESAIKNTFINKDTINAFESTIKGLETIEIPF